MALRDPLRPRLAARDQRALRLGLWVALGALLLRSVLAAWVGLGDDEAYTWQWSTRVHWRYFDHPPLVAWLVALSRMMLGDQPFAVRLPALFSHSALCVAMALWAARRSPDRPGAAAALVLLLLQVLPVFAVAGVFVAPDGPLLASWAVVGAWLAAPGARRRQDWIGIGVFAGLAALSKHVGFVLWPGILWSLLVSAEGRAELRTRGPWLGLAVAVVVSSPTWMALVEGSTLAFHLTGRPGGPPGVSGTALLLVGQALYVGPCAGVLCALGRRSGPDLRLGLPLGLVLLLGSPWVPSLPHWLAPVWLSLLPCAAGWLLDRPAWRHLCVWPAGLATGLLFLQAASGLLPLPSAADPTTDLWAWEAVEPALRDAVEGSEPVVVVTGRYQVAAQVAWSLRDLDVPVTRRSGRPDQYDAWRPSHRYADHRAVVVGHDRYPTRPEDLDVSGCSNPESKTARRRAATRVFTLWRCSSAQRLK